MQMLWGMVNTLQLIVHMPLLAVIFPANAQFFLQFIVKVVNFNIIPTDKVIGAILTVEEKFST